MIAAVDPKAGYDTLFFGSSRMTYALIPSQFDSVLASRGVSTKSFNAALAGARPHDYSAAIEWCAKQAKGRVRYAFIEAHSWESGDRDGNWMTDMEVELHSPQEHVRRMQSTILSSLPLSDKVYYLFHDAAHTTANVLNIGQGSRVLDDWTRRMQGLRLSGDYDITDKGFIVAEAVDYAPGREANRVFLSKIAEYERLLEYKKTEPSTPDTKAPFNRDALLAQASTLSAAGITPIFVIMPSYFVDVRGRDELAQMGDVIKLIVMDRVADCPELYAAGNWYDAMHMSSSGARVFTQMFADKALASGLISAGHTSLESHSDGAPHSQQDGALSFACSHHRAAEGRHVVSIRAVPGFGDLLLGVSASRLRNEADGGLGLGLSMPLIHWKQIEADRSSGTVDYEIPEDVVTSGGVAFCQAAVLVNGQVLQWSNVLEIR
jgi:hypothetical protein